MARKKRINGLSVAIVALNIVIIGIIILLVVLIYFHMKEDAGNGREEYTNPPITTVPEQSADTEATTPTVPSTYNPAFFSNDLFIGDSISTGLTAYDFIDKANVFAEVGLNPESALTKAIDGVTCIQKAQGMQPTHIYIMLGSNGLAFLDSNAMAEKVSSLVEELQKVSPSSQISVLSIPPVTKEHDAAGSETMEKVNAYNTALKNICQEKGYKFIDICSVLTDEEGYFSEKYAENDGMHFLSNTYKVFLATVQNAVQ